MLSGGLCQFRSFLPRPTSIPSVTHPIPITSPTSVTPNTPVTPQPPATPTIPEASPTSPLLPLTENPQVFEVISVKREVTVTPPVVKDPKIITFEVCVAIKITWSSVSLL